MIESGYLTEEMIIEATNRATNEGGGFHRSPISLNTYLRVVNAIKSGAKLPLVPFQGEVEALMWLSKLGE